MARILRFPSRQSQQEKPFWISPETWQGFLEGTKKLAELLRTH